MDDAAAMAATIWAARQSGQLLDPNDVLGDMSMPAAYDIQRCLTQLRLDGGERVVGWKLGYTSQVMRDQMGVSDANFGPLTNAMLLSSGDAVAVELVQPRVEPEIAIVMGRELSADEPHGRADVLACIDRAVACLEVVHSTWVDYRFTIEHNTADGSSAAQVVIGRPLILDDLNDLDELEVELLVDGEVVGKGCGRDASGHPIDGVVWLVDQLARSCQSLHAGDIVITGGLTSAAALLPGSTVTGVFSHNGFVASTSVNRQW
jgi:2-keto-4-pentenoate hydratase